MNEKEDVKALWKICFDDDDSFIDLYFDKRYTPRRNISIYSGEKLVSALQMIPYSISFMGGVLPVSYISGASTHPDFRNRGTMRTLLQKAHKRMYDDGVALSTLIPANDWLFDYYKRNGYSTIFYSHFSILDNEYDNEQPEFEIEFLDHVDDKGFDYIESAMKRYSCAILHDREDLSVVMEDMVMASGKLALAKRDGKICGSAFVIKENDKLLVKEILCDSDAVADSFMQTLASIFKVERIVYRDVRSNDIRPYGMARVINMEKLLSVYAMANHNMDILFHITGDNDIAQNNGYFYIKDGAVQKEIPKNQKPLEYTVNTILGFLFLQEKPYMNMMMD